MKLADRPDRPLAIQPTDWRYTSLCSSSELYASSPASELAPDSSGFAGFGDRPFLSLSTVELEPFSFFEFFCTICNLLLSTSEVFDFGDVFSLSTSLLLKLGVEAACDIVADCTDAAAPVNFLRPSYKT